ncbi:MAG TPA: ATP-binding protein [Accumulibacter sp.]|nr:ATP-binding protein [Accumulibacter sp.]HMX22809.1 ATP-binding protein [Accumulibacter sp.]HMY06811.1 ATP-binding protein [Accumulibacter sp.]HNC17212.1 ATP-binding protein [Accumulibacter sp.]HND79736.1 ATP-binding protein [Accumulibacter sp.]
MFAARLPAGKTLQVTLPVEPLEHALANIIGNAVDWSRGRPYARVSVRIELRHELGSMPLCIRVSDQGLGVGRDAERNLSSPRLTEKGCKGQGMGLHISRTLLRSIGGDLVFDRQNSFRFFGATFEIRLPLCFGERMSRQDVDRSSNSGSPHVR